MYPTMIRSIKCIAAYTLVYLLTFSIIMTIYLISGGIQPPNHINTFALGVSAITIGTRSARKHGRIFSRSEYTIILIGSFFIDFMVQFLSVYHQGGLPFVLRNWMALAFIELAHIAILASCYSSQMLKRFLPKYM